MDKDEINIPQRGRPRKSREMAFQPTSPVQHERANVDFEGMLDVDVEESVNDLLQREYRKYVDRNKLDINQNNLENYLKPKELNRKWGVKGERPRLDFEKRDGDIGKDMFQSQGQILSHISSIFPEKNVSDNYSMSQLREERVKRGDSQIERKLGLTPRNMSTCDDFVIGQFKDAECGTGGVSSWTEKHSSDGKAAWAADSMNVRKEGGNDDVSSAIHVPAYGTGDLTASCDAAFSGNSKQSDVFMPRTHSGEALNHRGDVQDAEYCTERYRNQEDNINKSSEFSPRFGTRHEVDFYGLEPRQNTHCNLYSAGQADVAVDYSQRRFYTREQNVASMPGKHGGDRYGRHHREAIYQYEMNNYCDHIQNDASGNAFTVAGCNFAMPMGDQAGANSFSMCRQERYQDGMHRGEGFAAYKREDHEGFSQQRADGSFSEQKGVNELDMAQQAAYWRDGSAGYQSNMHYTMNVDGLRHQNSRRSSEMIQDVRSGFEHMPYLYRQQDAEGDKLSASDQNIAQYINSKYSAGTSLGQTLSHSSNVSSFEPNPNNPLFQNYSMWVNRKKRKNNPLLWQYINQGHSFVHPSKYSNLDYVHKKMYLGTITQIPIEKNNHQILPLFLNSTSNTPEFMKIGSIFLERTCGLNYDNVTVMQLKNLMKEFGLCHNGKKTELIERVKATVEKIELKMNNKKNVQSVESQQPVRGSHEEDKSVDMDDVADDAAFMYF